MIVNLNQREIEGALKMYLTQQGINLSNKAVKIDFTAGRKESGLSAEVNIDDVGMAPQEPITPTSDPIPPNNSEPVGPLSALTGGPNITSDSDPKEASPPAKVTKSTSLFGG